MHQVTLHYPQLMCSTFTCNDVHLLLNDVPVGNPTSYVAAFKLKSRVKH